MQRHKKGKAQIWMKEALLLLPNVQTGAGFPHTHTHKAESDSNASKEFNSPAWHQQCKVN